MKYQRCTRCLMDTSAQNISFNDQGFCNFCEDLLNLIALNSSKDKKKGNLEKVIDKIKKEGSSNKYDCIVGVSGGVDSSWVLVKAKEFGLKPLAVHMDNGWNSELAQSNISNLITSLNIDFYTHVIDWEEYKNLMQAFFNANVVDIELLYDNAMLAVNYKLAKKFNIKYILSGMNNSTEGMAIPENWHWYKFDKMNIKAIAKKNGLNKFDTFPSISTFEKLLYEKIFQVKWINILDFLNYKKDDVLNKLEKNYGYKRYKYKHYESIFTRFYQGYILPEKFGIDKRLMHLSTLIITKQINRAKAIEIIKEKPYSDIQDLKNDKLYFLKKMNWTEEELKDYLSRDIFSHEVFDSEIKVRKFLKKILPESIIVNFKKFIS